MEKLHIDLSNRDFLDLRKEYLNVIKSNPLFIDFIEKNVITDEEIMENTSKFLKVMNDNEGCDSCNNLNCCKKGAKGIVFSLGIDSNGEIELILSPCKENLKKLKFDEKYIYRDFDDSYLNYEIRDTAIDDFFDSRKEIINAIKVILKDNFNKGVYFYGSRQCGKTFIMSVFSKKIIEKYNKSVAFIDTPTRIRSLNDLYFTNKEEFDREINKLINVDVLIFDDFGNEYKNDIIRDNIVYPLLNERLKKKLLTCFVSNYSLFDVKKMYSLKEINSPKSGQLVELIKLLSNEIRIDSIPFRN